MRPINLFFFSHWRARTHTAVAAPREHRKFLSETAVLREAVAFRDAMVVEMIHRAYRVQYLKVRLCFVCLYVFMCVYVWDWSCVPS